MLLSSDDLPEGFAYPVAFGRFVARLPFDLRPWVVLDAESARLKRAGLAEKVKGHELVPFAMRDDMDAVACFVLEGESVVVMYGYSTMSWDRRRVLPDFYAWLRMAIEDLIDLDLAGGV